MKNRFIFLAVLMLVFPFTTTAQITGFMEDFNDNILTGWQVPPDQLYTFEIYEQDSLLKIVYHRVTESWEWDNINFIPPQLIDLSNKPQISVKAKSDVITELTLKPIYENGGEDWVQQMLPNDNQWHTYLFELNNAVGSPMNRIYFYLDGGTTVPKSGTVYFDDLRFGDSVNVILPLNLIELETALIQARALYDNSVEGTGEGQFAIGSKAILQTAINDAQVIHDSPTSTQQDIDRAVWDLYDACVIFESGAVVNDIQIIDNLASKETKYLFFNLKKLGETNLLFGMQDPTGYGVGWSGDDDRSDVRDVCGSYPAVYGWGLRPIALGDDVTRNRYRMTSAFERGGINTMEWHQYDPKNRGFYASDVGNEKIVPTLLPGGEYHALYKEKLWRIARYMKGLRGAKGQSIPVIFRPYHEHTGSWFWWGQDHCTKQEFIQLWQFTIDYLRDSLNVHNLLVAYSPASPSGKTEYLDRYPGDDYVDILGFDNYLSGAINPSDIQNFVRQVRDAVELAQERDKVAAITETGRETLDIHDWFTRVILNPIKNDSVAAKAAYVAVWRNASVSHHYAPYPGHPSVPDFLAFFDDPFTMFEDDLPNVYAPTTVDNIPPFFKRLPDPNFVSYATAVEIEVQTSERAHVRYCTVDQPCAQMPYVFERGQGNLRHFTTVYGQQGQQYVYYIRAMDLSGNAMDTSAVVSFSIDTLGAPIHWTDLGYIIDSWKNGTAPLGYGDPNVVTEISSVRTAYFRHEFNVEDINTIAGMVIIIRYDNGAVVYLNGKEIARLNMPFGEMTYEMFAETNACGYKTIQLDPTQVALLKNGTNILAVEMHQFDADTTDMIFDLRAFTPATLIAYGSNWDYFDSGWQPAVQKRGTAVNEFDKTKPQQFILYQNYPNPFNPVTEIRYQIPNPSKVEIAVYNVLGKEIKKLVNEQKEAGNYVVTFDASHLTSGLYFYRLKAGDFLQTKKMILIR